MRAILNLPVLFRDALLIGVIGAGLALAAATQLIDDGTQVFTKTDQQVFRESRFIRVEKGDLPVILHRVPVTSHGGKFRIEWYDGAWSPSAARTVSFVSIYVDDNRRATAALGGFRGPFESRPAVLVWSGTLEPGQHVVEVKVDAAPKAFAIPFAERTTPVTDGVTVTEVIE